MLVKALFLLNLYILLFAAIRNGLKLFKIKIDIDRNLKSKLFRFQRYFIAYYVLVLLPCIWIYT